MNVLNPVIHRDDDATPIRMTRFDRLTIDGVPYILNQATSEGLYLNVDDAAGRSMFFDHEELRRLAGRKRLRMDPDFHHPERANRMNAGNRIALQDLDPKSAARLAWRSALVEALSELHAEGLVKLTDESIEASFDTIMGRAMACLGHHDMRRVQHAFKAYDNAWRPNASTLRKWRTAFAQRGLAGLLDDMAKRGGKGSRLDSGVQAILWREVSGYMHPSRPSKKRIHERICRAVEELNVGREADGLHRLGTPSRTTVRDAIAKLDRCAVHVARYGEASARKTFRAVNKGLGLTHLLERVEMDEHALDLFTMAKENDWRHMFTDEQWQKLELSKGKARFWITTAICCTSRAILGVTITPTANSSAAMKTLAMVMSDKGRWSDAVGATGSWNMYGRPETVVTDCGAAFRSEAFRFCCAELGIAAERTSAGNPEKRGRIERIFRTVSSGLCARLSGHSFSSILAKGDADPEADAALSLEDLAFVLVRWIVDIYHNTPHEGLGGETPAACWNRLAQMYGVNPSPDMERFRIAFGSRYKRSLTKAGVTILGVRYHSRTLADHMARRNPGQVDVRWHPEDIGTVSVRIGDAWHSVPAVFDGLDGVHADSWLTGVRAARAGRHAVREIDYRAVLTAIEAIEERNQDAVLAAGLKMDQWNDDRIQRAEKSIFQGVEFREPAEPLAEDGILGRAIPDRIDAPEAGAPQPKRDPRGRKSSDKPFGVEED